MRANTIKRRDKIPLLISRAAIHAVITIAHDLLIPNVGKHSFLQFVPVMDDNLLHDASPLFFLPVLRRTILVEVAANRINRHNERQIFYMQFTNGLGPQILKGNHTG